VLLSERLEQLGSVLVAFSGGVDSGVLLTAAVRTLGPERVAAATTVSAALPAAELDGAAAFCRDLGVRHLTPAGIEGSVPGYVANGPDRCAWCKSSLVQVLLPVAASLELAWVATGTHRDDLADGFRPGVAASRLAGAVFPLADAGLGKQEVRALAHGWGLSLAAKPAAACLASRVVHGVSVTPARLARIERSEARVRHVLAEAGITSVALRVRDLGEGAARIEVDPEAVGRVPVIDLEGFSSVDVQPYRPGGR
jgi:uncharacterized protein